MKIYPYKQGSASAKALADALGIKRIKHEGKPLVVDVLINWGASNIKRVLKDADRILNHPAYVARASNKLLTFQALTDAGVRTPEWTESHLDAEQWLIDGFDVVARHKLNGHSGDGIEIYLAGKEKDKDVYVQDNVPLFTKYIKKKEEYRIHVFQGEAFFVQRKARKLDVPLEEVNWQVRNLAGGFIFAHKGVEVPDVARNEACNAVAALALDFGAVDIMLGTDGNFYVLEVNTACGLEGTTLEKYVEKFQQFQ